MEKYLRHYLPKSRVPGSTSMKHLYEKKDLEKYGKQSVLLGGIMFMK
jgi:hypothetical protein